ncbi:MAG: hypothetical protein ABI134_24610 [Byssovorax sp.]
MLKHLNIHEMVGIVAPWANDAKRKAQFLSIPEIAALHPKITQIHAELLSAQPASAEVSTALQKIIDSATAVDTVHDPLARAVWSGIEADRNLSLAASPPDPERARQAEEVQAKLFPGGMSIINASLLAESGNTARVAKLLEDEPATAAFLKAIPVRGKTTLLDTAQRWIAAGAQLGKLEREREAQEAKELTQPLGKAGMNALRARWIRLVSQVLANLELSDAAAESIEVIRGPVLKASERAGKRYEGGAVAAAETVVPAEGAKVL